MLTGYGQNLLPAELLQHFKSQEYGIIDSTCTDQKSYEWLQATIAAQWEGHEIPLQLVQSSEVTKLLRADMHPPPGSLKFLKLIQAQNKGLHPDQWLLQHQQTTNWGQLIIWGMDVAVYKKLDGQDQVLEWW